MVKSCPWASAGLFDNKVRYCGVVAAPGFPELVLDFWLVGLVADIVGCIFSVVLTLVLAC